jgi:NAD(P)-dependent dehydrogenase (short-subunit alcohol dehydrogenase family)
MEQARRVALITGGGSGIGREIAIGLAATAIDVVVVGRREAALATVASEITNAGHSARYLVADVSSIDEVEWLRQALAGGPPSILVNAAGTFGPLAPVVDSDPVEWLATIGVNTVSSYLTARAFAPAMIAAGWGRILNLSSAASLHPPGPGNSAYGTSKVALNQFTRQLATELEGTGVTVNVFHPGDVRTEMFEDIRRKVAVAGSVAALNYGPWVEWMDSTGGDPPHKAVDLVLRVITGPDAPNGEFLWIDEPLRAPVASWEGVGGTPRWG